MLSPQHRPGTYVRIAGSLQFSNALSVHRARRIQQENFVQRHLSDEEKARSRRPNTDLRAKARSGSRAGTNATVTPASAMQLIPWAEPLPAGGKITVTAHSRPGSERERVRRAGARKVT